MIQPMNSEKNSSSVSIYTVLKTGVTALLFLRAGFLIYDGRYDQGLMMLGMVFMLASGTVLLKFILAMMDHFFTTAEKNREAIAIIAQSIVTIELNTAIYNKNMEVLAKHVNRLAPNASIRLVLTPKNEMVDMKALPIEELNGLLKAALDREDYEEAQRIRDIINDKQTS